MELQDYSKPPYIEGVEIIDLKQFNDTGGSFSELLRVDHSLLFDGTEHLIFVGSLQINHSKIVKGTVKAFHCHKKQTDIWYVMDRAIVVLHDPESNITMKIAAGVKPQLIIIPPGVLHGIASPYGDVNMIYFVNRFFNPEDEFRLPWDYLGKEIWEIDKG